jgi:hypothetical protein
MITPLNIEESYEGYVKKVYPFGVGEIQRVEMKRVFYAAVHLLLCHLLTFGEDIDAGDRELNRLLEETNAFAKKVGDSIHRN